MAKSTGQCDFCARPAQWCFLHCNLCLCRERAGAGSTGGEHDYSSQSERTGPVAVCRQIPRPRGSPSAMPSSSPASARAWNSQNIKRNADTVVDAITAQDIGALPDRSVTEALQRVPGVSINRFAGSSDPDHFSAEGSGVVVRGLTYVRSEFNGRDTFSTGVYGQAINFQDVPAELLGSVEVYKETTADRIEGGLSGTINMNSAAAVRQQGPPHRLRSRGQLRRLPKKWSPVGSLLVSDNWDTGIGRIGLLGAISYSKLYTAPTACRSPTSRLAMGRTRSSQSTGTDHIVCRTPLARTTDTTGSRRLFPASAAWAAPCFGARRRPNGFYDFCRHALCADRRPVPHPGIRSQAARLLPPPRNGKALTGVRC